MFDPLPLPARCEVDEVPAAVLDHSAHSSSSTFRSYQKEKLAKPGKFQTNKQTKNKQSDVLSNIGGVLDNNLLPSCLFSFLKAIKCPGEDRAQIADTAKSTGSFGDQNFFDFTYGNAIRAKRTEYVGSKQNCLRWQWCLSTHSGNSLYHSLCLSLSLSLSLSPYSPCFHLVFFFA